jgi:hypothetical protein
MRACWWSCWYGGGWTGVTPLAAVTPRATDYWSRKLYAASSHEPAGLTRRDVVALDYRDMPWRLWVAQAIQVPKRFIPINRYSISTVPPGTTLVIVPWDVRRSPLSSWSAAPLNFAPATIRDTYAGGWVAWRRVPWHRMPPRAPQAPQRKFPNPSTGNTSHVSLSPRRTG